VEVPFQPIAQRKKSGVTGEYTNWVGHRQASRERTAALKEGNIAHGQGPSVISRGGLTSLAWGGQGSLRQKARLTSTLARPVLRSLTPGETVRLTCG